MGLWVAGQSDLEQRRRFLVRKPLSNNVACVSSAVKDLVIENTLSGGCAEFS
jgi:hypothetical protein